VVERRVDDAIRAGPQDPPELEGLSEEYTYP
jgi:hypothetical protein